MISYGINLEPQLNQTETNRRGWVQHVQSMEEGRLPRKSWHTDLMGREMLAAHVTGRVSYKTRIG